MYSKNYNTKEKKIYFKVYQDLSQLETALNTIKETDVSLVQISILGKVSQYYLDKEKDTPEGIDVIKNYWKKTWGNNVRFGGFYNPEIGNIFIVGSLVSTFLHKIDGKSLATLSSGPYGILRGLGVCEDEATKYLKTLNSGKYLLVIRGFEEDLWRLEHILEKEKLKS